VAKPNKIAPTVFFLNSNNRDGNHADQQHLGNFQATASIKRFAPPPSFLLEVQSEL